KCFFGTDGFDAFLRQTDILVCLLPLTPDTRHILDRAAFERLSRSGPLGAPVLINAGRGGLQNEADILACLDDGTLGAASLDVFETEP
ncbi:NAD(P)-dependent oxidoreductase, partial [Acinetobacter baumannii]